MDHTDNLRGRVDALEDHARRVERRLRWWRGIAFSAVMLSLWSWALPSSMAKPEKQGNSAYGGGLEGRLAALEYKLQYVTGGANEVVIAGANLRIVNGLGTTETTNGLGNLIVGYNESRTSGVDDRTGSHNVVVGSRNNFSSFGGLVVGSLNEISGEFASVSGGIENAASGIAASISGGRGHIASGVFSAISGGELNTATGEGSSISGGESNTASKHLASISGGFNNTASGDAASVSGGRFNKAVGDGSSVSAGFLNTADGFSSSVSGGLENAATGSFSSVSGGHNRIAPGQNNWAAGPLFADN